MNIAVILPAAGVGRRFAVEDAAPDDAAEARLGGGGGAAETARRGKVELDLAGKPVFLRAVEAFIKRPQVGQVILAVAPDAIESFRFRWGDRLGFHGVSLVEGGTVERWETVMKALEAVEEGITHIAVHDAVRPLVAPAMIDRVFAAAETCPAVVPAVDVVGTLRRAGEVAEGAGADGADAADTILGGAGKPAYTLRRALEVVDRTDLVEIQTPQVFERGLLADAYARIARGELSGDGLTDDAGVVEAAGGPVYLIEGDPANIKITRPADLEIARAVIGVREKATAAETAKKRLFGDDDD